MSCVAGCPLCVVHLSSLAHAASALVFLCDCFEQPCPRLIVLLPSLLSSALASRALRPLASFLSPPSLPLPSAADRPSSTPATTATAGTCTATSVTRSRSRTPTQPSTMGTTSPAITATTSPSTTPTGSTKFLTNDGRSDIDRQALVFLPCVFLSTCTAKRGPDVVLSIGGGGTTILGGCGGAERQRGRGS